MNGLDIVGADYGGLVSSIFQAGGAAVDYAKASQKEKEDATKANTKLQAAIAADQAATNAVARATMSARVAEKDPTKAGAAKADAMAARSALAAQDKAGVECPDDKRKERTEAAQKAVDDAEVALQGALRGGGEAIIAAAQAKVDAAKQTLDKTRGVPPAASTGGGVVAQRQEEGFLSKTLFWKIKVWHALLTVLGAGGGAFLWYRSRK